jgi:LysM repeat protein
MAGTPRPDGQKPGPPNWRPTLSALAAIGVIVLTISAAFLLALRERFVTVPPAPTPVQVQATPLPPTPLPTPLVEVTPTFVPTVVPTVPPGVTLAPVPVVQPTATPIVVYIQPPPTSCIPRPGWVAYQVEPHESLNTLAARYGISVEELIEGNCLTRYELRPGDIIAVPRVTPTPTATATRQRPECRPPERWVLYTVQPGDTLYSLAERTHTDAEILLRANCLRSDQIYPGQQIWLPVLPPPPTPTATYPLPATPTCPPPTCATATPTFTPPLPPTATFTPIPPPPTATPLPPPTNTPPPPPTATFTPPPTNTPVEFIPPPDVGG